MQVETRKPSRKWYLLPIFFTLIGGLVMWGKLRNRDSRMAKNGLILGIIEPVVLFVGSVFVAVAIDHING